MCTLVQEIMLRRLKRDVMAELPPKRRQVVRLPCPKPADWPNQKVPEGEWFPPCVALHPTDEVLAASDFCQFVCYKSNRCVTSLMLSHHLFTCAF